MTHGYCLTSYSSQSKGVDCVFVAESSESFRAAGREQFYVSASRFKESLTIYTDDKHQLLDAVRKSSQRPSALDFVTKEVVESTDEVSAKKPLRPSSGEDFQRRISEIQKWARLQNPNVRESRTKGIGI